MTTEHRRDFTYERDNPFGGRIAWVGLVIEVEPGKFMHTTLRADRALMVVEQEDPPEWGVLSAPSRRRYRFEIEGHLATQEEAARPEWATAEPAEVTAAPRAIGS